jgi:hypothetical protein
MGKVVNVITIYDEWLKEVNVDLTTHSRWVGDMVPPVLLNFPAHLLAPKLAQGSDGSTNGRQAARNNTHQGGATAETVSDRAGGESKRVCTHPLLQWPSCQVVLPRRRQLSPYPTDPKPGRPVIAVLHSVPHRGPWMLTKELYVHAPNPRLE